MVQLETIVINRVGKGKSNTRGHDTPFINFFMQQELYTNASVNRMIN